MNRPGAGPPPLRTIAGNNSYQQPAQNRIPLGSGRLQNGGGKLGSGSGWGFGIPNMTAAPGLPNPQSRPNSAALTSFARTIGGSQSATPLDLALTASSEFPSLSGGASQPQHQASISQAAWASATQRATSQTSSRPLQPPSNNPLHAISRIGLQQQQPIPTLPGPSPFANPENQFGSVSHFTNGGMDDFGLGGGTANPLAQMTGASQPKTGSIDEFPPLGRNANGEIGQPRAGSSSMSSAGFGVPMGGNGNGYGVGIGIGLNQPQSLQGRSGLLASISGARPDGGRHLSLAASRDASSPLGLGSGVISATRSSVDSMHAAPNGMAESERNTSQNGSTMSSGNVNPMAANVSQPANGRPVEAPTYGSWQARNGAGALGNTGILDTAEEAALPTESLTSMGELDRYGLEGLLHMIRDPNSDMGSLAVGQEMNLLGLDLQQADPLYPTFASPFADANMGSVEPEFAVPACYDVQNIHPLPEKVSSFSDETLFYVFYQMPRDVMQEVVAGELSNRNWRYHKELKQWLTKDTNFEPVRISPTEERGYYIFFDPSAWQRQRREFVLSYDSLDSRPIQPINTTLVP